jgi:hypothetical protein
MTSNTTKPDSSQHATETAAHLFDNWFDPIEAGLRDRVHEFLHAMFEGELDIVLSRPRYARRGQPSRCDGQGGSWRYRSSPRLPVEVAAGKLRPSGDRCPARPVEHPRWQDDGVEEPGAAGLPAAHTDCRRADRQHLPCRHQHAVWGRGRQGHCEPGMAQGEERLGRLECPLAGQRADRAAHSRRHGGARPA